MTDTTTEAVEAAWDEYEASAKPCGNDGDMEFYNVEGMAEEAHNLYTMAKALAAERDALITQLVTAQAQADMARDALTECVEEIDGYIQQEYPCDHPVQERRRQRDYAANPARIALALIQPTPTTPRPAPNRAHSPKG